MANNLLDSGYSLTVYNRTAEKAKPLVRKGARLASNPADTVVAGGIVISVLWDTAAVESVITSEDFLARLGSGGVHVSVCTGLPEAAKRLASLHAAHG